MGQIADGLGDIGTKSWGDLSGPEQFGKVMLGGLGGLGQGMQKQQQQPQGGGGQIQLPQAPQPQVQLPMPQGRTLSGPTDYPRGRNPFFYGEGQ